MYHIILRGQTPTVKNPHVRKNITTVLNLDKNGALRSYISGLCDGLGISLDKNVYATNLLKNFFTESPVNLEKLHKEDIINKYSVLWLDVLMEELKSFPEVPVLILGEPLLNVLANSSQSKYVKYYWGYTSTWKNGNFAAFNYINASDNKINRVMIPFPHQPSIGKEFYRKQLKAYCDYIISEHLIR